MNAKHTSLTDKELGTIQSVLAEFNDQRLPRLLDMKRRVKKGERLDGYDISYLAHGAGVSNHQGVTNDRTSQR